MTQEQFDDMRLDISIDTLTHEVSRFERFKRALWYGSNGQVGGYLGDGKGLRKTIRRTPQIIAKKGVMGVATLPIKALTSPLGLIPVVGSSLSGQLNSILSIPLEIGFEKLLSEVKTIYTMKIEDGSSYKTDLKKFTNKIFKNTKQKEEEEIRKKIKQDVKDLKGENLLVVIDRNMVKMKDAEHKIGPAIKKMEKTLERDKSYDDKLEAARDVIVAIIETEYYSNKITTLINTMQDTLTRMKDGLNDFNKRMEKVDDNVEKFIIERI